MKRLQHIGCVLVLLWCGTHACAGQAEVARLGDYPVRADEFAWHAGELRTEVAARLMRQHGVAMSPDFWTTPLDGVTPEASLRREALRRIARCVAIQQLAVESGLLDHVKSYRELVADFHAENQRRRTMKAAGEVFYGPVQYRQDMWYEVWLEQLRRALARTGAGIDACIGERTDQLLNQPSRQPR